MKILYTTTVGLTMIFFKNIISELVKEGHTVDIACNESDYKVDDFYRNLGCNIFQLDWTRSPFSLKNVRSAKKLKNIIEQNEYDIVHCHTPVAGACTRLVCKKLKKNSLKVFYTAHGFHFYKGAPFINWLLYYPLEKYFSRATDVLITINKEDYKLAKAKMKAKKTEYIPGVGIDIEKFKNTDINKNEKRKELGIPENATVLLSVGELNINKNQQVVIKALKLLNNDNIHYAIVGEGVTKDNLIELSSSLQVNNQVHFLGYRTDINEIMKCADIFVHPSFREGLPVSVIEAMASGLTVTGSAIRGMRDLIPPYMLVDDNNELSYAKIIKQIISGEKSVNVSEYNTDYYAYKSINEKIKHIYSNL